MNPQSPAAWQVHRDGSSSEFQPMDLQAPSNLFPRKATHNRLRIPWSSQNHEIFDTLDAIIIHQELGVWGPETRICPGG